MNKRTSRRHLLSASGILTACILGLLPAGCGDSAAADKHALKASDEAARLAASAGAYRPTEKLTAEVKDAGWQADKQAALNTKLLAAIKGKTDYPAIKSYIDGYLKQNSVEADLATALKKLASTGETPGDAVQCLVQAQTGNTANQLAAAQMSDALDKVGDLLQMEIEVQSLASDIARISAEGGVGEGRKAAYQAALDKAGPAGPGVNDLVTQAKAKSDDAAAKLNDANAKVASLQGQIDQKRKEAQEARSQGQELQNKSDQAKGDEALKIFEQSMTFQATAAAALAQTTRLQPDLDAALADQKLAAAAAQTAAADYDEIAKLKTDMQNTVAGGDKTRQAAQKLLDDTTVEFNKKVTAFDAAAAGLEAQITKIVTLTDGARKNFTSAQTAMDAYRKAILEKFNGVATAEIDPLVKGLKNKQLDRMFDLSVAELYNRSGHAHLLIGMVAQIKEQVAAAKPGSSTPVTGAAAAGERKAAVKDFQEAARKGETIANSADAKNTPLAWLSLMVRAVALEGQAIASPAEAKDLHAAALKAASDATAINPQLIILSTTP